MRLKIFRCSSFDRKFAEDRFAELAHYVEQMCDGEAPAVLIANYKLGETVFDALFVWRGGAMAFIFRDYSGALVMETNKPWLLNGQIIMSGTMSLLPYAQFRRDLKCVSELLSRYLEIEAIPVHICMIMNSDSVVEDRLGSMPHEWLFVGSMQRLKFYMDLLKTRSHALSDDTIKHVPNCIGLESFSHSPYAHKEERIAHTFYTELTELASNNDVSMHQKYEVLRDLFRRMIDMGVSDCHLAFSDRFAKLDFLLKECKAEGNLVRQIFHTRLSLAHSEDADDETLSHTFRVDLQNVVKMLSLLFRDVPIPKALQACAMETVCKCTWGEFYTQVLKCMVDSWDDAYIYVTEEQNGMKLQVCYDGRNRYLTRNGKGDWGYLQNILWPGAQLNLVRLRFEDEVCMPELIIFEPDYLLNVTTVASCFEPYAESPFVHMLNKIKPQAYTKHIMLGSLSGIFLDNTVHQREQNFDETFRNFFRTNAIAFTACKDLSSTNDMAWLSKEAGEQQKNIEKLIGHDLPGAVECYDTKDVFLEPTFFSNVLGLQGRLDFLYEKNGQVIIIEQKSGKSVYTGNTTECSIHPQEKHLVQLILYRAIFAYEFSKYASQLKHVMLLYSRYSNGLVSVGTNPQLLLRAIKMRNLLAWSELLYAKNGYRILETFTADKLNKKRVQDSLWLRYQRPQIEQLLQPLHKSTELERMYFFRFMQFLSKEQLLAKMGNKEKEGSGFSSLWNDTLEEKKLAGNIYDGLSVEALSGHDGSVERVVLRFPQAKSADSSNFRRGDIVVLYPYACEQVPLACAQMVHRASIEDITTDCVTLVLRNIQTNERIFQQGERVRWAIEHDMIESSVSSLFQGLYSFLSAPKRRRDLILCQRKPQTHKRLRKGEYGAFNTLVEHAKQAEDFFLVIGPPGTGKTSYGLLNILKEELLDEHANVLLLSYTNRAVDEICSKLKEEGIDFVRLGSVLSCDDAYHDHLLSKRVHECNNRSEVLHTIQQTRVFCATTSAFNANMQLFQMKQFDLAIVDESSQILEPHLIALLSAQVDGQSAIRKFVFIGDHKQLPAVVQQSEEDSLVLEPELRRICLTDCRLSLFERLLRCFKTADGYDSDFVYMLTKQGRMHRDIADFPNKEFYEGKLDVVPLEHQVTSSTTCSETNGIAQLLCKRRVVFVASPKTNEMLPHKVNPIEADMIAATVVQIYKLTKEKFSSSQTIGVIVPYRNQIATVRVAIDVYGIDVLHDITIDTVERYQGSQRDYIIYGFTVQHSFQLKFLTNNTFIENGKEIDRKLNVAMTRARTHLILIGNTHLLSEVPLFSRLITYIKEHDGYVEVDWKQYCTGSFLGE